MRNTTKLKALLYKYTASFDLDEQELFNLVISEKNTGETTRFQAKSYSEVIAKAYSYLLKELKREERIHGQPQ